MLCSIENDERHPSPRAAVLLAKALEIPKISRRLSPKLPGKNALLLDWELWMKNRSPRRLRPDPTSGYLSLLRSLWGERLS